MYPPISANSRVSVNDDVAIAGGRKYYIPAGTHIACGVFQMQRRIDLWGNDANLWRPQRWLESKGVPAQNGFAFQAWGVGPRIVNNMPLCPE
jgi:cytochrome P450